jgi:hypothetical protein
MLFALCPGPDPDLSSVFQVVRGWMLIHGLIACCALGGLALATLARRAEERRKRLADDVSRP